MKYAATFMNGFAFKPSDWGDTGLPILRIAQLTGGEFDNFYDGYIDRRYVIENGDLLFSWSATLDSFEWNRGTALLNQHIFKVTPAKGADQRYLFYSLKHHAPIWADVDAHGSTMRHIKKSSLSNKIWLPDFNTQKTIADFLDRETARIDQLIEKKERLVALLGEKQRSDVSHMFAEIQERKWRTRHLGRLRNGAGFPVDLQGDNTQEVPFFKVKHLKTHGLDAMICDTDDTISRETARQLRAIVFPKETIVFAKIGAALLLGRFSMLGREACIDNNMAAFVPDESLIHPEYALLALSQIDMTTMAQPGAVPSMSTEAFYNFEVALPDMHRQREFVQSVRSRNRIRQMATEKTITSIDRLREYRAALITAAVTGQIDTAAHATSKHK